MPLNWSWASHSRLGDVRRSAATPGEDYPVLEAYPLVYRSGGAQLRAAKSIDIAIDNAANELFPRTFREIPSQIAGNLPVERTIRGRKGLLYRFGDTIRS